MRSPHPILPSQISRDVLRSLEGIDTTYIGSGLDKWFTSENPPLRHLSSRVKDGKYQVNRPPFILVLYLTVKSPEYSTED